MLIFVLVFWHFLQSNTPLIAQEKVCPNRHTFSSFMVTYSFRYVMCNFSHCLFVDNKQTSI